MIKECVRCHKTIDCQHNSDCFCVNVKMNAATRDYLSQHYSDCLCADCLNTLKARFCNTIVCDLGGVLIDHNIPACKKAFAQLLGEEMVEKELGLSANAEGADESIMYLYEVGKISTAQMLEQVMAVAKKHDAIRNVSEKEIIDAWNIVHKGIMDDKFAFLKKMREQGKTLYLLSNINEVHWQHAVDAYHIDEYFDECFLSYKCGCCKPDARFPKMLIEKTNLAPEDAVFIDDLADNRTMGAALGWATFESIYDYQNALEEK